MASYYTIGAITIRQTSKLRPGALVDDTQFDVAALRAAGNLLWPSTDAYVSAAALSATRARERGADDAALEQIMRDGVDASLQAASAQPGPPGPPGPPLGNGVKVFPISSSPIVLQGLAVGQQVLRVFVSVVEAFDGASPKISVGTTADPGAFFANVDASVVGQLDDQTSHEVASADFAIVTLDLGGATRGYGYAFISVL